MNILEKIQTVLKRGVTPKVRACDVDYCRRVQAQIENKGIKTICRDRIDHINLIFNRGIE